MLAARNVFFTSSIAAYDAVGTGSSASSVPSSFNFTAAVGADIFIVVTTDRSATMTGATVAGSSSGVSEIASFSHNNASGSGTTKIYRKAGGGTGSAVAIAATGSGAAWWIVNAISFIGVNAAGTATYNSGSSTSPSQSVSGVGLQVFSDGNGGGSHGTFSAFSGVTNRSNTNATGDAQAISTVETAGTASATLSSSTPWAAIFIPLS